MNTTKNTSQQISTRFGSLKALGRGIAVSSAVAVMGVSTMSAADASAAGIATGVRHTSTAAAGASSTLSPTNLDVDRRPAYVIRDGKVTRV